MLVSCANHNSKYAVYKFCFSAKMQKQHYKRLSNIKLCSTGQIVTGTSFPRNEENEGGFIDMGCVDILFLISG